VSRRLREFNRQHLREMLQAERLAAVGRFARAIVHDLKNPLTAISLAVARACAATTPQNERDRAASLISRQVDRATALADDIIDFTQRPPSAPALEPIDFSVLVLSVVADLQTELAPGGIKIAYESPPPAVPLRVDPRRMPRVFANLLRNAADAMPAGGTVSLRFRQTAEEVSTEVRDTGLGLSAEIKPRLFEPFATFGKTKGTGLGLAICKQIVEEHGGSITAANHPQKGAVFTFTLPRPS
jgi:signal transduction histidine kinase